MVKELLLQLNKKSQLVLSFYDIYDLVTGLRIRLSYALSYSFSFYYRGSHTLYSERVRVLEVSSLIKNTLANRPIKIGLTKGWNDKK